MVVLMLPKGLVVGDMVYCSGQVGTDPATGEMVEGTVADRAVSCWNRACMRCFMIGI
jgi:2-iminobutanoate/2-iminopropanoate deaminase